MFLENKADVPNLAPAISDSIAQTPTTHIVEYGSDTFKGSSTKI